MENPNFGKKNEMPMPFNENDTDREGFSPLESATLTAEEKLLNEQLSAKIEKLKSAAENTDANLESSIESIRGSIGEILDKVTDGKSSLDEIREYKAQLDELVEILTEMSDLKEESGGTVKSLQDQLGQVRKILESAEKEAGAIA